jgi:ABC-type transport system substrate-binding protein
MSPARSQDRLVPYIGTGDRAGNTNMEELNDPVVNNLLKKMASTTDEVTRNSCTAQIDMQVMKDAAILPAVYAKSLLYRGSQLTNVFVQPYYARRLPGRPRRRVIRRWRRRPGSCRL